jgi:hypothetical protein
MPKWLQKSLVVLISVLTFGLVTPPQSLFLDRTNQDKSFEPNVFAETLSESSMETSLEDIVEDSTIESEKDLQFTKQKWVQLRVKDAEERSFTKFGEKIKPVIEDEFREIILPNIEKVITLVAEQYPEDNLNQLVVTEFPGKGKSEKIFHIIDQKTGTDVVRFHVRRDQPPQDGYWFNFHYHTYHDQYQTHHDLGSIYWAKNTPPNWMS